MTTARWPFGSAGRRSRDCRRAAAETLVRERRAGPFTSYGDFVARTGFTTAVLSRLAAADAFRSLGLDRRPALWHVAGADAAGATARQPPRRSAAASAAALTARRKSFMTTMPRDSRCGAILSPRCAQSLDAPTRRAPRRRSRTLEADRRYRVAGLVLVRQRPGTAKGITFMTLEDETGTVEPDRLAAGLGAVSPRRPPGQGRHRHRSVAAAGRRHSPDRRSTARSDRATPRSRPCLEGFSLTANRCADEIRSGGRRFSLTSRRDRSIRFAESQFQSDSHLRIRCSETRPNHIRSEHDLFIRLFLTGGGGW